VMLSAASCLRWATELLGLADEAALLARVEATAPAARARAPLFLPYLTGERTPHDDPHATGVLFGLLPGHGAADIGYAVLEGVAFGLLDGIRCLGDDARSAELRLVGGGSRSALWCQLLASVLELPLLLPAGASHGAALGAARLGWLAVGGTVPVVCTPPTTARTFAPNGEETARSRVRYERWAALYPSLRERFAAAAN
jgi:xylulokinase